MKSGICRLKKWIVTKIFPLIRKIKWEAFEKRKYLRRVTEQYSLKKNVKNIFIIGVPNHANLGDYAIGYAEQKLFGDLYPNANVVTVNMSQFGRDIEGIKMLSHVQDILILTGGGNLGNVYMDDEDIRRRTLQMFPDNQVILFPQTMYFTDDEEGRTQAEITRQIYNQHRHLILTAREEYSLKAMEKLFQKKCYLLPDVVMTLKPPSVNGVRKNASLCLRSDSEGILREEDWEYLHSTLEKVYDTVEVFDTVRNDVTDPDDFPQAFEEVLRLFRTTKLVITDRLHGMILAAVTQTPCIVLDNYNYKIRGCYAWLKELPYIKYVSELSEVETAIAQLGRRKECEYPAADYQDTFKAFLEEVIHG